MSEPYENRDWGHGSRPLFGGVLNNKQHGDLTANYSLRLPKNAQWEDGFAKIHSVTAHDNEGDQVGRLEWHPKTGEILGVDVSKSHRRKGIATAMYRMAQQLSGEYGIQKPKHSDDRSDNGDAWARSVGGRLPKRISIDDFPML